jgi:hypothetical protein
LLKEYLTYLKSAASWPIQEATKIQDDILPDVSEIVQICNDTLSSLACTRKALDSFAGDFAVRIFQRCYTMNKCEDKKLLEVANELEFWYVASQSKKERMGTNRLSLRCRRTSGR